MGLVAANKKEKNVVEVEVSVSAEAFKEAVDRIYRQKSKNINVPGFRKGKAPRALVERHYGENMFYEDAVNDLFPQAYLDAMDEGGLEPVGRPEVELMEVKKETGFSFKATVTVKPEVKLGKYKGVEAEKTVYPVEEADIDAELERLRERNARIVTAEDRAAKEGDEVVIDFEGFVDGEAFQGGKAEGHRLELGSHSFIDTFEQQIEGHAAGDEFEVNVTFPEQYHAEELAGKPAMFKVKLTEIKYKEMPELDDEFVKDVSEFDTLAELRDSLRQKRADMLKERSDSELETAILERVAESLEADIPEVMFTNRVDELARDFEYQISRQGMNMPMYLQYIGKDEEAFKADFMEQAQRQVKMRLVLETVAKLENLEATEEDLDAEYKKAADNYGVTAERMRDILPEKEVKADILSTKALNFIRDNAVVTEKAPEEKTAPAEKPAKKPAKQRAKKAKADAEAEPKAE